MHAHWQKCADMFYLPKLFLIPQLLSILLINTCIIVVYAFQNCPTLKSIVKNCDKLVAVRYLSDILSFIKLLRGKFHSQFTRTEAQGFSAKDFIAKHSAILNLPPPKLENMVQSFINAWNVAIKHFEGQ